MVENSLGRIAVSLQLLAVSFESEEEREAKEKLGKKARKQLDSEQRSTWAFSPVTKKAESKKLYNRKRKAHDRYDDYGMGFSIA